MFEFGTVLKLLPLLFTALVLTPTEFGQGIRFSRHVIGESIEDFKADVREQGSCNDKSARTDNKVG